MTLEELAAEAARVRAAGLERVMLVVPAKWKAPPGFPRRELACVNYRGESVVWVRADRLAAWCEKAARSLSA